MKSVLITLFLALSVSQVAAQKVYVTSSANDIIGQRFTFALKEAVRKSATWSLVPTSGTDFRVELVSINPDSGIDTQHQTAISVTIEFEGVSQDCKMCRWPLDHEIYIVGSEKVDEMSGTLLAKLDQISGDIKQVIAAATPAKP
ncbi:MAG TPA: hypothetical protein VGG46_03950 [Terriglobales bacterium]|jgi:hypothetical protein